MSLPWCMLALALLGADEPRSSQPEHPSTPPVITFKVDCRALTQAVIDGVKSPCGNGSFADQVSSPPTASKRAASASTPVKASEPQELWPMTLPDAIRIGLDNSEIVRVISFPQSLRQCGFDGPASREPSSDTLDPRANSSSIVIARLNADAAKWRFKSEVMAHVRTVEQLYWRLVAAHSTLWAADRAFEMTRELVTEEEVIACLSPSDQTGDLVQAKAGLERFNLDLVTRTSDVIVAERQLRNALGLPPADNRRIIPVTPPTAQHVEFDWATCVQEMMHEQPDIIQQRLLTRLAELRLLVARHPALQQVDLNALYQFNAFSDPMDGPEDTLMKTLHKALGLAEANPFAGRQPSAPAMETDSEDLAILTSWHPVSTGRNPLANTRQAQYGLLRSRAFLRQVVHQTTHSLARSFLEVDANFKQYARAHRVRDASEKQLAAQCALWESGKITVDRYLGAIAQFSTAVANEHQYLATYNASLAFVSEVKGTLLTDRNIIVARRAPRESKAHLAAVTKDEGVAKAQATVGNQVSPAVPAPPAVPSVSPARPGPEISAVINAGVGAPRQTAAPVEPRSNSAQPKPLTWTLSITFGGDKTIELHGTLKSDGQVHPEKTTE